jgi:transposase-like protein
MNYQAEHDAYLELEERRWHGEPECPHCGSTRAHYIEPDNGLTRRTRTGSLSPRRVWFCGGCREQFSVLTGTVMSGTKIPVTKWLQAMDVIERNPRVSARKLGTLLGIGPDSANNIKRRLALVDAT